MATEDTPSIEVRNLTKRYGTVTAVKDISFTVDKGEVVGFLGPNGAGKSTTMRILCGLQSATSGEAFICGHAVASEIDKIKTRIGFMPENNPLPEDMRVIEYLRFRAELKGVPRKSRKKRIEEVMDLCDLNRKARRKIIGSLSKGFRQRVGIADAILAEPDVIVMDEPTIGLDPHQILGIRRLIDSLRGRMTVVLSSHILAEIEVSCDRVIIINQGHVVATGTPRELRKEFLKESEYELRIKGDQAHIESCLKEVDPNFTFDWQGPRENEEFQALTLSSPRRDDLGEHIYERCKQENDISIARLNRKRATLEDIFLSATKRSWEEEGMVKIAREKENHESDTVSA